MFPDAGAKLVQKLKLVMPSVGRHKIADVLARGGLHLAPSTAERLLKSLFRAQVRRQSSRDSDCFPLDSTAPTRMNNRQF
jgi:hypothetical protein